MWDTAPAAQNPLGAARASGLVGAKILAWVAGGPDAASGLVLVGTRGPVREVVAASLPPDAGRLTLFSLAAVAKKAAVIASVSNFLGLTNLYEVHVREKVRAKGGAVLLVSEDLDELLELSDRIAVMSEGRIVFETAAASADRRTIGSHMGGDAHHGPADAHALAEAA